MAIERNVWPILHRMQERLDKAEKINGQLMRDVMTLQAEVKSLQDSLLAGAPTGRAIGLAAVHANKAARAEALEIENAGKVTLDPNKTPAIGDFGAADRMAKARAAKAAKAAKNASA